MEPLKGVEAHQWVQVIRLDGVDSFKTTVQAVTSDYLLLRIPARRVKELDPARDEEVEITVFTGQGMLEMVMLFSDRSDEGQVPVYRFSMPPRLWKRVQRREYYRLQVALEVRYQFISPMEVGRAHRLLPSEHGYSIDLSGGGLRLTLGKRRKAEQEGALPVQGGLMAVRFELTGAGRAAIAAATEIRRVDQVEEETASHWEVGLAFVNLPESNRDQIIDFIFRRMREQRRLR